VYSSLHMIAQNALVPNDYIEMEPTVQLITPTYLGGSVHLTAHYNVPFGDSIQMPTEKMELRTGPSSKAQAGKPRTHVPNEHGPCSASAVGAADCGTRAAGRARPPCRTDASPTFVGGGCGLTVTVPEFMIFYIDTVRATHERVVILFLIIFLRISNNFKTLDDSHKQVS